MSKQTFTTGQILTAAQMTTLQANDYNWTVNAKTASYTLVATDAGTRITMTSASATTITVNTSLFTAGDVLEIINLGAGVCTITAGTATVSTSATLALKQYDAGSLFFNSTSAAVFFSADAADNTSPLTTKGDLYTYSTTDARLAVGNNGESIYADSSATTGLRYSATPSASNPVINSATQIWQRGTSFTVGAAAPYTADRWQASRGALATGLTVTRQATNDTTNLPIIQYCARLQRDSGNTSTAALNFWQNLETVNSIPFAGKTVTMSFYARAGANYSPTSSLLTAYLYSGTGTDQNVNVGGFTGVAAVIQQNATLTTTWQRFTYTGTVAISATQLATLVSATPVGTASTNDYFEVTGVQIDVGSVALPFRTAGTTYQQELAACQRYYVRWSAGSSNSYIGCGNAYSTTTGAPLMIFPVEMRVYPTALETSGVLLSDDATNYSGGTLTLAAGNTKTASIRYVHGSATLTAFRFYYLGITGSTGYLGLSAEL